MLLVFPKKREHSLSSIVRHGSIDIYFLKIDAFLVFLPWLVLLFWSRHLVSCQLQTCSRAERQNSRLENNFTWTCLFLPKVAILFWSHISLLLVFAHNGRIAIQNVLSQLISNVLTSYLRKNCDWKSYKMLCEAHWIMVP